MKLVPSCNTTLNVSSAHFSSFSSMSKGRMGVAYGTEIEPLCTDHFCPWLFCDLIKPVHQLIVERKRSFNEERRMSDKRKREGGKDLDSHIPHPWIRKVRDRQLELGCSVSSRPYPFCTMYVGSEQG